MTRDRAVQLSPELRDLVRRSASVRRGLALLHRAPVEAAAVALGVHPGAVERARAALADPGQRAMAVEEFVRAAAAAEPPGPIPMAVEPVAATATPEALLALAARDPATLELLVYGPVDVAAIVFAVHPALVGEARRLVGRGDEPGFPAAGAHDAPWVLADAGKGGARRGLRGR